MANNEEQETIGLDLSFRKAAILNMILQEALKNNRVPFERIPDVLVMQKETFDICKELMPNTDIPKIKVYQKIPRRT